MSPGGVDMRTGRYVHDDIDLSIGDTSEVGGLVLKRTPAAGVTGHINPLANFTHNWDITLYARAVDVASGNYTGGYGPDVRMEVSFGGRTSTFQANGSETYYTQVSHDSWATLTFTGSGLRGGPNAINTYTAKDGTIVTFRPLSGNDCAGSCAFPSQIVYGDGTTLTFEYETQSGTSNTARLRSIVSNHGYAMLFEYTGIGWNLVSKACVINLAGTTKPADNLCPAGATSTAYSYTTYNGVTKLTGVTDSGNNTWSHTYAASPGADYAMGFVKPGASSPWMTNAVSMMTESNLSETEHVFQQAFADGSGYSYAYDYTPQVDGQISSVAGGTYTNALNQTTQVNYAFPVYPRSLNPRRVYVNGIGQPATQYSLGDVVFQVTPGPAEIVDPLGRTTTIDNCDPVVKTQLPPSEHQRCLVKRIDSITEPDGNKTFYKYEYSFVTEVRKVAKPGWDLDDVIVSMAYYCTPATIKSCDKPVTATDAKGAVTNFTYSTDHGGVLTETRPAPVANADRPQKRYSYGQFYAWYKNASGTLVQAPTPVWLPTAISECSAGTAPGCIGTANETRTTFVHGTPGTANNLLLTSRTVASGDGTISATTSWSYDADGNRLTEDGPLPGTDDSIFYRYDTERRLTGEIGPDPDGTGPRKHAAQQTWYTPDGQPAQVSRGTTTSQSSAAWSSFVEAERTNTTYDALGRPITVTLGGYVSGVLTNFNITQKSYDLAGRLECTTVRMNMVPWYPSACALGSEGSSGPDRVTRNIYDAAGQLLQTRVAAGTADEAADVTYSYTPNGKQRYVIDGNGNRAELRWDGFDRQASWVFPANSAPPAAYNDTTPASALATAGAVNEGDYEAYQYDANGNQTSLRKRDGSTLGYTYDTLNRLTIKAVPGRTGLAATHTRSVYTGYDLSGLQTYARFDSPTGEGMAMTYDALGRLTSTTTVMDGVSRTLANTMFDTRGNRTELTWMDGLQTSYAFDTLSRITRITRPGSPGLDAVVIARFGYDDLGRKAAQSGAGSIAGTGPFAYQSTYGYDPASRLNALSHNVGGTSATVGWTFGHNPAGQIAEVGRDNDAYAWLGAVSVDRPYATNGLNQYQTAGPASFGYDANGNLTSDGSSSFTYDIENRLVAASGARTAGLRYDPLGRLYETTGPSGVTRFLYDGDELVAEYDGSGMLLRRFVHGTGVDDPVVVYEGSGITSPRWLLADYQGSIVGVIDASSASTAINAYDEYGIPKSGNYGRFQYTGQAWLPDLGMYYYKARIYSPTLGRFMQTDPIGYEGGGPNLYAYVGGDPVNAVDPDGRTPLVLAPIVGSTILGIRCAANPGCRAAVIAAARAVVRHLSSTYPPVLKNDPAPDLPDETVGEGPEEKKGNIDSGPLREDKGGTGDYDEDFDTLSGGTGKEDETGRRPPGTRVGDNGVQIRPKNSSGGVSIDIPAKGARKREVLHYPPKKPPPPSPKKFPER